MPDVSFGQLVDPEQQAIDRRRLMAKALQEQAMAPMQQQVVSGRVVRNSPIEGIAKIAQALLAGKQNKDIDASQKSLVEGKRQRMSDDITGIVSALRGSPGRTINPLTPNDDEGNVNSPVQMEAQAPDMNKALALALRSEAPGAQGIAGNLLSSMMPKASKWEKMELPNPDGSKRVGFVDIASSDPLSTFKAGGTAPVKNEYVNGQGVNPYTGAAQGSAIPKQLDADSVVTMGPNGQLMPNRAVIQAKSQVAAAGKPVTNVSVNTATKPFLNEIGKGVGEQVINDYSGARSASQVLGNVAQIESGLKNVIVGPGAGARVKLGQIGQVLGINGKDATEQLQNTRQVMQGLARQELSAAAGMKGQGQITESERGILRRAEAGQIDELTVPEIQSLLGALRKTSQSRINTHNQNLERLKKDPNAAGVVDYMALPNAPSTAPQSGGFKIIGVQ